MLRFFRIIRNKLLMSGLIHKYLLYAIGEILLVVIGILIALQVNNWNEQRIRQNQVTKQLLNLKESLEIDVEFLARTVEINEFRSNAMKYFIELSGRPFNEFAMEYALDSQRQHILEISNHIAFPQIGDSSFVEVAISWFDRGTSGVIFDRSAMDEFNNLGLFSEIQNDILKRRIRDYYRHIDWTFNDREISKRNQVEDEFATYLRDTHGIIRRELQTMKNAQSIILGDQGIIVRLLDLREDTRWHQQSAIHAYGLAQDVLRMIEEEVAK